MNPASPGLPPVDNVYGVNGIPNNGASATCVSCHTYNPVSGRSSHFVSHWRSGANRTTQASRITTWERITAWTGSGGNSKYGRAGTWTSDNTAGEVICESCHNMRLNVPGGNNLLEDSLLSSPRPVQAGESANLCEGCHAAATMPGHHPMTGDQVSDGSTLSNADSLFTRGFVSATTEMGVPFGGATSSEVRYPALDSLPCLSCHGNGHSGYSGTGARILRRGAGRDPAAQGGPVTGTDNTGLDRQYDKGSTRLIGNYTPLCDACHKSDD